MAPRDANAPGLRVGGTYGARELHEMLGGPGVVWLGDWADENVNQGPAPDPGCPFRPGRQSDADHRAGGGCEYCQHSPVIADGGRRCNYVLADGATCDLLAEEHPLDYDDRGLLLPAPGDTCDACKSERIAPAQPAYRSDDSGDWWLCVVHYAEHRAARD